MTGYCVPSSGIGTLFTADDQCRNIQLELWQERLDFGKLLLKQGAACMLVEVICTHPRGVKRLGGE